MKKNTVNPNGNIDSGSQQKKQLIEMRQHLKANWDAILKDIKNEVLNKYDLGHLDVSALSLLENDGCGPGMKRVYKNYGTDQNGKPIIRSACVPA